MKEALALRTAAHEHTTLQHVLNYDRFAVAVINAHPKKAKQTVIVDSVFATQHDDNVNTVECICTSDQSTTEVSSDETTDDSSSSDGDRPSSPSAEVTGEKRAEKSSGGTKSDTIRNVVRKTPEKEHQD